GSGGGVRPPAGWSHSAGMVPAESYANRSPADKAGARPRAGRCSRRRWSPRPPGASRMTWGQTGTSAMLLGYNTNGFAHHRLTDACDILADLGSRSVALTLDYHALDPYAADLPAQLAVVKWLLGRRGLRCVVETGARFLLDPRHKHQPTLVSAAPDGR